MHLCVCLLPFFVQACLQHFNLWPLGVALCLQSSFYRLHGTSGGNDTVHSMSMSFCSTKSSFLLFKCPSLLPHLSISYIVKSSHKIKGPGPKWKQIPIARGALEVSWAFRSEDHRMRSLLSVTITSRDARGYTGNPQAQKTQGGTNSRINNKHTNAHKRHTGRRKNEAPTFKTLIQPGVAAYRNF